MTSNRSTRYLPDGFRVLHEVRLATSSALPQSRKLASTKSKNNSRGLPRILGVSPSRAPRERDARGILMFLPEKGVAVRIRSPHPVDIVAGRVRLLGETWCSRSAETLSSHSSAVCQPRTLASEWMTSSATSLHSALPIASGCGLRCPKDFVIANNSFTRLSVML